MKIRGAKQVHYDSGPNMIPLVDIVLVILIFLMLAGNFGQDEHYLINNAAFIPQGIGQQKLPPNYIPPTQVRVLVDLDPASVQEAEGMSEPDRVKTLRYQATVYGTIYHSYSDLEYRLRQIFEATPVKDQANMQVIISPGLTVLHKHLIDVYDAALDAGFTRIAFAAGH
ncbi:MAG TPA: biopolymer transporter ExbD [Tepidisphaeraceae bacterium]|nr:biopolymer transporter ExbD [Tepidisphaeraceae bacterium]